MSTPCCADRVFNSHHDVVQFTLPAHGGANEWVRLLDTNIPEETAPMRFDKSATYGITGRSVVLFMGTVEGLK